MNSIKLPLFFLITVVITVVTIFIVSALLPSLDLIATPTARLLANILSLGVMIQSAIFSMLLIRQAEVNRKNSDNLNAKAESFRNFQFIVSNRTTVEFHAHMSISRASQRYVALLKENLDFKFYMRHNGVDFEHVKANLDEYSFLTVRIPLKLVVGDELGAVKFMNFSLDREGETHTFIPCCEDYQGLILWNEEKQRREVSVNLILPKGSGFYNEKTVTPFSKIKIFLSMHSTLGVVVRGWTELYFTNPLKRERDGSNKYHISSSQFKISGLPELEGVVGWDDIKRKKDEV
ncbi:MAG: hypothetical protein FWE01_01940 [Firmicutes bacterium]|nr:hypothetical protein [Bacillota bacterium]